MAKKPVIHRKLDKSRGNSGTGFCYVKSLVIKGIRSFRGPTQTLSFVDESNRHHQWTLILGNNGTGKSTILQLLSRVVLSTRATGGPSLEIRRIQDDQFSDYGIVRSKENWTRLIRGTPRFDTSSYDGDASFEAVTLGSEGTDDFTLRIIYSFLTPFRSKKIDQPNPGVWCVFGYGAWRSLGESTLRPTELRGYQCPHLFSDKADLINAEEWLLRLDYGAEHPSKFAEKNRQRFEQVKETLLGLLPDEEVEEIRIGEPIGPDRPPRLLFKTPYGEVELRQLGYGYQSLIAWVVDFAAQMYETYPESPNPLAEPAVCLIDEIDLHLHPKWQRDLMDFLSKRFPKTQFIATAHSPLIVQAAEEIGANVVVLRREGDHVVIDNDPISVKGWRVDQILSSELFDETPLRAGDTQEWMNRRTALLKKAKLTAKEKTELQTLNAKADELPLGRTAAEISLNDRLKNAVELLEKAAKGKK